MRYGHVVAALLLAAGTPPPAGAAPGQYGYSVFVYREGSEAAARSLFAAVRARWAEAAALERACVEAPEGVTPVCPVVGGISPDDVEFAIHAIHDPAIPWGEYDIQDMEEVWKFYDLARFANAGVIVFTAFVTPPEGYLHCILPLHYRRFVEFDGAVAGGTAELALDPDAVAEVVARRLHVEIDADYLAWHRNIMANLFVPDQGGAACDVVDAAVLTADAFEKQYVRRSRPVVIENGAAAVGNAHWDVAYLRGRVGNASVTVKIAPDGVFEGAEDLTAWEQTAGNALPEHVYERLVSKDRVIVRPAMAKLSVEDLFARLQSDGDVCPLRPGGEAARRAAASFYLEYSSLAGLKRIAEDVSVPRFAAFLKLHQKNVWFGGATLGKLHFDPYDNIMSVAAGVKTFTLFHPHRNERAREGHIREAFLHYDAETGSFSRSDLPDSTALVMSPLHINAAAADEAAADAPDFAPLNRTRLTCRVGPGDALYLPAFWWHEVDSAPPHTLAANLWFKPYFDKPFPCATCRIHYNREVYGQPSP